MYPSFLTFILSCAHVSAFSCPPDCLCAGIDMNLCYDTNLFYQAQSFTGDSHHYPPLKQQPLIRRKKKKK
jgi:hypothetical protein